MDEKSEFLHAVEKAVDFWCKKQPKTKKKHRIKTTFKAEMRKSWTQHVKKRWKKIKSCRSTSSFTGANHMGGSQLFMLNKKIPDC